MSDIATPQSDPAIMETLPIVDGNVPPAPEPAAPAAPAKVEQPTAAPDPAIQTPTEGKPLPEKVGDVDLLTAFRIRSGEIDEHSDAAQPKAPVEPAKPAEPVKQVLVPADPAQRDYTGIAEEHKQHFTKMGNEAFALAKKAYVERNELASKLKEAEAKTIPQSYFDNPNAYILTPEFREASQTVKLADTIKAHWEEQLVKMRNGQKVQGLAYDDKGQLVLTEPIAADANTEAQIIQAMTAASNSAQEARRKAANIRETFTDRNKSLVAAVRQQEEKYFPNFDKEDHPAQKYIKEFAPDIPPAFADHPLTKPLLKAMSAVVIAVEQVKARDAEIAKLKAQIGDNGKVQPTMRAIGSSNAAGAKKTPTYADFQAAMIDA